MRLFLRAPGVRLAPVGESWAAFAALSGETHLINSESVAVVEALGTQQALSVSQVCERLAHDHGVPRAEIEATLSTAWPLLIEAGLVREYIGGASSAP